MFDALDNFADFHAEATDVDGLVIRDCILSWRRFLLFLCFFLLFRLGLLLNLCRFLLWLLLGLLLLLCFCWLGQGDLDFAVAHFKCCQLGLQTLDDFAVK